MIHVYLYAAMGKKRDYFATPNYLMIEEGSITIDLLI